MYAPIKQVCILWLINQVQPILQGVNRSQPPSHTSSISRTAPSGYCEIEVRVFILDAISRLWQKLEEEEEKTGACLTGSMAQAQGEE